jgi:two-component system, NarL family, nitrate/nitrite response regulator NarL
MVRIALYTDEPVSACGFLSLLLPAGGFDLVAIWKDPAVLPAEVSRTQPDVLVIDGNESVALGLMADIRRGAPSCKVVLWVRNVPAELAYQAVEMGVRGILRRTLDAAQLTSRLRDVAAGELCFDAGLTAGLPSLETIRLTTRESQLLELLARGMKNREIASALSITEGTVKVYLSRLFQKAGVRDRYELGIHGVRNLRGVAPVEAVGNGGSEPPTIPRRGGRATPWPRSLALSRNLSPASSSQE